VLPELFSELRAERDRPLPRVRLGRIDGAADERLADGLKMQVVGLPLKAERLAARGEPSTALNRHERTSVC
jgi:hypothetical protein